MKKVLGILYAQRTYNKLSYIRANFIYNGTQNHYIYSLRALKFFFNESLPAISITTLL